MNTVKTFKVRLGPTDDRTIRAALVEKRLHNHRNRNGTLLIHELGLAHARGRIDLAVINGVVHGYEIKSELDTLRRLESQLDVYCRSLQKLTFVVTEKHISNVIECVPSWCGVQLVKRGHRGAIHFTVLQKAIRNPNLDLFVMAHLLWRQEVHDILAKWGTNKAILRSPRTILYRELVANVSEAQLTGLIKKAMMQRSTWRDQLQPTLYDG